jgi:hypothetical protein
MLLLQTWGIKTQRTTYAIGKQNQRMLFDPFAFTPDQMRRFPTHRNRFGTLARRIIQQFMAKPP